MCKKNVQTGFTGYIVYIAAIWMVERIRMAWGNKLLCLSVFFTEALARWQWNEETVTGVIWVFDDFDSSAFAAFEVDVLQRGENRPWDALS